MGKVIPFPKKQPVAGVRIRLVVEPIQPEKKPKAGMPRYR